jgi:hypothetical protein
MKKLTTKGKDIVYIEIQYSDESEFHFNVEVEGKESDKIATILMITRGTLMVSNGTKATAYNEEGFEICSYIR